VIKFDPYTRGNSEKREGYSLAEVLPEAKVRPIKVLTVTTVDITLGKLLPSLIHALNSRGYVSECASADGPYAEELRAEGIQVHPIAFKRRVFTLSHVIAFLQIYRLMCILRLPR
jgi:hypothetical protein